VYDEYQVALTSKQPTRIIIKTTNCQPSNPMASILLLFWADHRAAMGVGRGHPDTDAVPPGTVRQPHQTK
jgi:hypothetical protein